MVPKKHSWRRWQVQGPPRSHLAFNPSPPRPSRPPCPPNPRPHGASLAGVGGRGGASDGNSGACTILASLWVRTARPPLSFAGAGKGQSCKPAFGYRLCSSLLCGRSQGPLGADETGRVSGPPDLLDQHLHVQPQAGGGTGRVRFTRPVLCSPPQLRIPFNTGLSMHRVGHAFSWKFSYV